MKTLITILVTAVIAAGAMFAFEHRSATQEPAPSSEQSLGEIIRFTTKVTPSSATVAAANAGDPSTLIVATSSARQYCAIVNDSANTVYIGLSPVGSDTQGGKGIRLNANGGAYEILASDNLYTGAIYGIASSSSRLTISCI